MYFHLNGILGWLLKPLMALCMLGFAAGSTALGGDMGGGGLGLDDGGGDGEGGDGEGGEFGDGSEQDGSDAGEIEEGDGATHREDGNQATRLSAQQRADQAREKALPANVKKALAAVKETDPKAADVIRRAVFAQQAWQQVMPGGIRQAREMAQAFEEVGGVEGIQTLRDETQSLQAELDGVDEKWTAADPEFFATLAENDPEAFSRALPVIVEQFLKSDPQGYSSLMGRIFYNTMASKGVVRKLEALLHHANANKATAGMAPLVQGLDELLGWTDSIQQLGQQQPERKPDKGLAKLKEKETAFERKQAEAFKGEVGRDIKTHLETGIMREVGNLLKTRNVNLAQLKLKDPERFMAMVAEADRQLTQAFNKDKPFHQQKDRLMQTKDKERVLRLYQQKINYLLADPNGPKIAKKVANIFYRGAAAPTVRTGQGGGDRGQQGDRQQQGDRGQRRQDGGNRENTQVVRVASRPDPSTIDYSRTTDDMILDGQAVLKGGKKVQWR